MYQHISNNAPSCSKTVSRVLKSTVIVHDTITAGAPCVGCGRWRRQNGEVAPHGEDGVDIAALYTESFVGDLKFLTTFRRRWRPTTSRKLFVQERERMTTHRSTRYCSAVLCYLGRLILRVCRLARALIWARKRIPRTTRFGNFPSRKIRGKWNGTRRGAVAFRGGTSSAPRWHTNTLASISIFIAAVKTTSRCTTRTKFHRPKLRMERVSQISGCMATSSCSTVRR